MMILVFKAIGVIAISYFVGSIPFGLIIGKIGYKVDIRTQGSGNIGATNIFRTLGTFPGILVLIFDLLKGMFAVVLARYFFPEVGSSLVASFQTSYSFFDASVVVLAAIAAISGHNWSVFLKFKGGKGIATGFGAVVTLVSPYVTVIMFVVWVSVLLTSRYVSLASVIGATFFPFLTILFHWGNYPYILFSIVSSFVVIYKHRGNIERLLKGEEPKLKRTSLKKGN